MKPNWKYIILFLFLAFGISAPVHLGYLDDFYKDLTNEWILSNWVYLLAGVGPFIAGLIAILLDKSLSSKVSIYGDDKVKNILIVLLPVAVFPIFGLGNSMGINIHLYGFIFAFVNVIYAFLEEFGWRKYLQNALEGINKNWKFIFIGVVWWLWHMRFDTPIDLYIFPMICIVGGFLLGKLADETKSILPIVNLHALIILLTNSGAITIQKTMGVVLTILGWIIIDQLWKRSALKK